MNKTALLAAIPLILASSTAFAEATDDGAAHLTEVFQTYLGSSDGVVSVEVDGDAYKVTLDAAPLSAMASEAGGSFSLSPIVMTVTDNGDGTWGVKQDDTLSLAMAVPGQLDVKEDIGSVTFEGVFDEALMTFSSGKGEIKDIKVTEKVTDPNSGEMNAEVAIASGSFDLIGTAASGGGVDMSFNVTMNGLTETVQTPATDGVPPMSVAISMESATQTGKLEGMRPDAFYKAIAWVVANPDEAAMEANKAGLKTILQDGIPLFALTTANMTAKNMTIGSPMGDVGIAEVTAEIELTGAVAEGKFREAFTLSGLTLPAGIVPDWAAPILPQSVKIDFQVSDFDAAAGFTTLLDLLDLPAGTEPDAGFDAKLQAAFLPSNSLAIGLNPGFVKGDGYELTYQGDMAVPMGDMPIPTGKATITLAGIEKLQAAIAAAPADMQGQAMMGIGMAQGMAKPGANGELVWEIDASTPGSLLVNGMDMMGMQ